MKNQFKTLKNLPVLTLVGFLGLPFGPLLLGQSSQAKISMGTNTSELLAIDQLKNLKPLVDILGLQWRGSARRAFIEKNPPAVDKLGAAVRELQLHSELASAHPQLRLTIHYTGTKITKHPTAKKLQWQFDYATESIGGFKKAIWKDIPYHIYIAANGEVAEGRALRFRPDTNSRKFLNNYPDGHITVVVEGDDSEPLSAHQEEKLFKVMDAIRIDLNIPPERVGIHKNQVAPGQTACPGPHVEKAVKKYLDFRSR